MPYVLVIVILVLPSVLSGCLFEEDKTSIEDFSITVDGEDCVMEVEFETEDPFYLRLEGPLGILETIHVQDTSRSRLSRSFFRVVEGSYTVRAMEGEEGGSIDSLTRDYSGPELELVDRNITYEGSNKEVRVNLNEIQIDHTGGLPLEVTTIRASLSFRNENFSENKRTGRYFIGSEDPHWVPIDRSFSEIPSDTDCEVRIKFDPEYQESVSLNFSITTPS